MSFFGKFTLSMIFSCMDQLDLSLKYVSTTKIMCITRDALYKDNAKSTNILAPTDVADKLSIF